jgi:hypothetical protein
MRDLTMKVMKMELKQMGYVIVVFDDEDGVVHE